MNQTADETKEWTSPTAERKLLTVREAATMLRVSEKTLFNYTDRGDIPTFRMGTRKLYDTADLWQYIERNKSASKGATIDGSNRD